MVIAGLIAFSPPQVAEATVSWPQQYDEILVGGVTAFGEDNLAIMSCGQGTGDKAAIRIEEGVVTKSMPGFTESGYTCDSSGFTAEDGTFYGLKLTSAATVIVAWRNGRELWSRDITYTTNCATSGGSMKTAYAGNMSIGTDGNLYMYVVPEAYPTSCADRLVGLNASTGVILKDDSISVAPGYGVGYNPSLNKLWTYDDKIVLVDRNNTLREFGYTTGEDTGAAYVFPRPSGQSIYSVVANQYGTVFAATTPSAPATTGTIVYHEDDGDTGTATSLPDARKRPIITASPNGNVTAAYDAGYVNKFDLANDTYTPISLGSITGYTVQDVMAYIEDENGNGLVIRNVVAAYPSTSQAVAVDVINATTSVVSPIFFMDNTTLSGSNPSISPYFALTEGIADGNLYLPICQGGWDCVDRSESSWIHKIPTTGFGEPVRDDAGRSSYADDRLEYVAMGDSFSSGEGNEPFNSWTANDGTNECHRNIDDSFPVKLANDEDLNLNLVDFVACSGATTYDILGFSEDDNPKGRWNEPDQIDSLSSNTDVVTISIGGNDIGFEAFAYECLFPYYTVTGTGECDEFTDIYAETMFNIHSDLDERMEAVLSTVLHEAENAQIYVIGYPYVAPNKQTTDPDDPDCGGLIDDAIFNKWGDARAAYEVVTELNTVIEASVASVNTTYSTADLHFVDVTESGSSFDGHDLCSSTSYFNDVDSINREYSVHPNLSGHEAYFEEIKEEIE